MKRSRTIMISVTVFFALLLSACTTGGSMSGMDHSKINMDENNLESEQSSPTDKKSADRAPSILTGPEISLTAAESQLDTSTGKK